MPNSLRLTALVLACALLAASPALATVKPAPRATAPRAASSTGPLPAPTTVVRSEDGRWVACDYDMKQEGWGLLVLTDRGRIVRAMTGWHAVEFEKRGSRLLAVQRSPDDDNWYALLDLTAADDGDMGEVPVRRLHRANGRFLGWIAPTLLVFEHAPGSAQRDTIDLTTFH